MTGATKGRMIPLEEALLKHTVIRIFHRRICVYVNSREKLGTQTAHQVCYGDMFLSF